MTDLVAAPAVTLLDNGRLGVWQAGPTSAAPPGVTVMTVARPDASGRIRRRRTPMMVRPVGAVLDQLLDIGPTSTASPEVHALAAVTRVVVTAVAEGRVVPRAGDSWDVAPRTRDETAVFDTIAEHLPASLQAEIVDTSPIRVRTGREVVARFVRDVTTAVVVTASVADDAPATRATSDEQRAVLADRLTGVGPVVVARLQLDAGANATFDAGLSLSLRNRSDHHQRVGAAELWADPAAATVIGADRPDAWLLARLRHLGTVWDPFQRLLTEPAPSYLALSEDEVADLLLARMTDLADNDVEVLLPRELVKELDLSAKVSSSSGAASEGSGAFSFDAICAAEVTASIDGVELTDDELDALADAERDLVRIRGHFVRVDSRLAGRLRRSLSGAEALGVALGGSIDLDGMSLPVEVDGSLSDVVARIAALAPVGEPPSSEPRIDGLNAELRHYQQAGVGWLDQVGAAVGGGILADDMGLGKTIQIIAAHLVRSADDGHTGRPTLVVAPASVVTNWLREFARFAPGVRTHRYHGPERSLDEVKFDANEVVVTTYATLRLDIARIREHSWGLVVADEAQQIKNHRSKNALAIRAVDTSTRIALSGTPVENRLLDLWALMDWALPGLLGNQTSFRRSFATPIERYGETDRAELLSRTIKPFLLRRTKSDPAIAPDLPPRTEIDHLVPLTPEQAGLYRAFTDDIMEAITNAEGIQRRGMVLKLLSGLKQLCNHPALWLDQPGPLPRRSGKLDLAESLLAEMVAAGDGALVFTQYVKMGLLLQARFDQLRLGASFLHGGTSTRKRQEMVDAFQNGTGPQIMVVSIKAGGTGLNLTRANHVVHFDRWWNPAVENQASDRAWRIGQDKPVFVHRLTSEGTVEQNIALELDRKRALADEVVGTGEAWIGDLDNDAIRALIELSATQEYRALGDPGVGSRGS